MGGRRPSADRHPPITAFTSDLFLVRSRRLLLARALMAPVGTTLSIQRARLALGQARARGIISTINGVLTVGQAVTIIVQPVRTDRLTRRRHAAILGAIAGILPRVAEAVATIRR